MQVYIYLFALCFVHLFCRNLCLCLCADKVSEEEWQLVTAIHSFVGDTCKVMTTLILFVLVLVCSSVFVDFPLQSHGCMYSSRMIIMLPSLCSLCCGFICEDLRGHTTVHLSNQWEWITGSDPIVDGWAVHMYLLTFICLISGCDTMAS